MLQHRILAAGVAFLSIPAVLATITCSVDSPCPASAPCCSQYGECGIGAYCLGGCNPQSSYLVDSCVPQPVCKNGTYTFSSLDSLAINTEYLGDSSKADWVYSGEPLEADGNLLVTMPNNSVGTVVASSTYVWYGKVSVTMKSSRGRGVVTACILFSNVQDEIDWEFVGADLETVQTNYYYQGILNWEHSVNVSLTDTFSDWHTYTVDWTEDSITWSVDGQVGRTLNKVDTLNTTTGLYDYPQTPSRVQMSIWPGGLSTNAIGTIEWAGGEIDWNSEDIQKLGYDYGTIKEVTIECYDPPSFVTNSGTAYQYLNRNGTQESVVITDDSTVLGSFEASGTDMSAGVSSAEPSTVTSAAESSTRSIPNASEVSESASATTSVPSVPDGSGGGNDLDRGNSTSASTTMSIPDASYVSESVSTTESSSSSKSSATKTSSVPDVSAESSSASAKASSAASTATSTAGSESSSSSAAATTATTTAGSGGFNQGTSTTTTVAAANGAAALSGSFILSLASFAAGVLYLL